MVYLTRSAVDDTLETVASYPPGSRIVLSYVQPPSALDEMNRRGFEWVSQQTSEMGEPFLTLFEPAEIEAVLRSFGFTDVDHFGSREAKRTYLRDRPGAQIPDIERLVTATI